MSKNDPAGLAHAKKLIKECLETQATFLDLGNCGLRDLSELPELWECQHLEGLNMGNYYFLNNSLSNSLNPFLYNKIGKNGALLLSRFFKNLNGIFLASNMIEDIGVISISENMLNLINLDLHRNNISNLGAIAIAKNLKKLESLSLWENEIKFQGIINIIKSHSRLKFLDLSGLKVNNNIINLIGKNLLDLTSLRLKNSKITDSNANVVGVNLSRLTALDLSDNYIGDIGVDFIISNCKKLSYLNLGNNKIGDKGAVTVAENINKLKYINLSENKIESIRPFVPFILQNPKIEIEYNNRFNNKCLNFTLNPIIDPPSRVLNYSRAHIIDYFRQKELTGSKKLLEAKMVLLGDGRAGKTSLACRLLKKELPKEEDRTKGVEIMIGGYPFPVEEGDFTLNIWDFAGQDKYKPLHQFFYSESSLYVMVADSGNAQTDFSDWFESANLYGEGSPLIVVLNEFSEGIGYGTFAEDHWKGQFPSLIKGVHLVNLLKQKDISLLERDIKHFARQLPHVQYEIPTNWANIRAELERRRDENFISFQEYLRICKENNLPERNSALILSSVLHKIGVCLHYQKSDLLSQHIILKNEWATNAVYKILEDHHISEVKKGFFDIDDLRRIWSDTEYQDMIPQLLELMREFKLAYPLPVLNEYVAPPLLPQAQPKDIEISETNALQVILEFEFLPKALMTQFIVSRHKDIDHNRTLVWRDGVVLSWPNAARAIVRKIKSRGRDAFQILVSGAEQRGLLTSIIKTLRDLCDEYKGIRVQEIVKCPCVGCQSGKNEQHFFEFKNLTHRLEKGRKTVECDKSLEEVDLLKLLGSLFIFEHIHIGQTVELKDVQKEIKDIKIFLASSSELAEDRDAFDLYFRQQNDYLKDEKGIYLKIERWENFLDAMSESRLQDEYNKEVKACDIFVSLFFTKTGRYTEEEFDEAHKQFKDSGGVKPQIFTFFKKGDVKIENLNHDDINTLFNFKKKLDALGHYHTTYDNIDQLKLKFRDQLDRLVREDKI